MFQAASLIGAFKSCQRGKTQSLDVLGTLMTRSQNVRFQRKNPTPQLISMFWNHPLKQVPPGQRTLTPKKLGPSVATSVAARVSKQSTRTTSLVEWAPKYTPTGDRHPRCAIVNLKVPFWRTRQKQGPLQGKIGTIIFGICLDR